MATLPHLADSPLVSVANFPEAEPLRRGHSPGSGTVFGPDDPCHFARATETSTHLYQRSHNGPNHLMAIGRGSDIEPEDAITEFMP
jgi:hypothetical protein